MKSHSTPLLGMLLATLTLLPLVSAAKYEEWFYWYDRPDEPTLSTLENGVCNQTFKDYRQAVVNGGVYDGQTRLALCYFVEDCMLDNLRASFQMNYQAAAVILGITPTLLATLGPRIGEISLLSTSRPLLSFLISVGAPAVWPTRVFEYVCRQFPDDYQLTYFQDDPSSSLGKGVNKRVLKYQSRGMWISILQYALVCGSIANMMQVAVMLGRKSVLTWSCDFSYAPLLWGLIPVTIHFIAAVSYHFEVREAEQDVYKERRMSEGSNSVKTGMSFPSANPNPLARRTTFIDDRRKLSWWQREFTICANQPRGLATLLKDRKLPWFAVAFNCIASLMAFFHLWFGTIIFSSLIFIAVRDILNDIFWRYILSTVICRLVLLTELMGMREEDEIKDIDKVAEEVVKVKQRLQRYETCSPQSMSPRTGVTFDVSPGSHELKNRSATLVERQDTERS